MMVDFIVNCPTVTVGAVGNVQQWYSILVFVTSFGILS